MARPPQIRKPSQRITPLWVVASFVTFTEVTLGYAVTKVLGGVQISLTIFVIAFALLVAGAFFSILWNRPWVFYAPSEYGDVNPKEFMSAMRDAPMVEAQVDLANSLQENPNDLEVRFQIVDAMADAPQIQSIIFMHETGKDIPRYTPYVYEFKDGSCGSGAFGFSRDRFEGTGMVHSAGDNRFYTLTPHGHTFAEWLIKKGRKCEFFWTNAGSWGTPSENSKKQLQQWQEQAAQFPAFNQGADQK